MIKFKKMEVDALLGKMRPRPALSGERKQFGLRRATKNVEPQVALSELAVVAVQGEDLDWSLTTSPFLFRDEFARFVGQELPMGIGPHRGAMVIAVNRYGMGWEVIACYLDCNHPRLLWRQDETPTWLLRGAARGETQTQEG